MYRVRLVKLAERQHLLLANIHHIVSDGWSMGLLIGEVGQIYDAYSRGERSPLEELPIQYADYAVWQRQWLQGDALDRQLAYWKRQLADPPSLELPTDRPRPAIQSYNGAAELFHLSAELTERLRRLSRQENATIFMSLLAGFNLLLSRYSGQEDIVVGAPIANRTRSETEKLIGFFVNTLALRTDLSRDPSLRELIGRIKEVSLAAYAHQDAPFERLVEELQPERDLSRSPLFQVMFSLQNAPTENLRMGGLKLSAAGAEATVSKFDLSLDLRERGGAIAGSLQYNRDLFEASTIRRMSDHLLRIYETLAERPEARTLEVEMLSQAERHQLELEWNDTRGDVPALSLHQLIEAQAERTPESIALASADRLLTYRELNGRANRLARRLRKLGVGAEALVGICLERSIELVVGLLGILKAGGAYLPLDPKYPKERLAYMLEDAGALVLLSEESVVGWLPSGQAEIIRLDSEWERIAEESEENLASGVASDNLSYVIYTSGSTGRPKGVAISHRSVVNLLDALQQRLSLDEGDVMVAVTTLLFDIAGLEIYLPLMVGARTVIATEQEGKDAGRLVEALERHVATVMQATPATWQMLREGGWSGTGHLKVLCGGEALWSELAAELRRGNRELWNVYGPTETTIWSTAEKVERGERAVSIGKPIGNTETYVMSGRMESTGSGIKGDLYIGGAGLARGYWRRGDQTAEMFVPHPQSERGGERLYRTGDVVKQRVDGRMEYVGRGDHQVKLRGYRIELGEVEAALREEEGVSEAAVVVRETEGGKRLIGYVVSAGEPLDKADLIRRLKNRLPEYMAPSMLVQIEAMPLTSNGKLDRKALPAPEWGQEQTEQEGERSPIEEIVAGAYREVLGSGDVGVKGHFFEFGGHSLLATRLVSRLREAFSVELALREVFEHPRVGDLARLIEAEMRSDQGSVALAIGRVGRGGALPLSFAQQRLWFLDQMDPGNAAYNLPAALRLSGELDVAVLKRTFNEVVRRHESLRTVFASGTGEPTQIIREAGEVRLPVIDLSELEATNRRSESRRIIREESGRGFDLQRGPLFRIELLRESGAQHQLMVNMHHIISDGWSRGVMIREVGQLYDDYSNGEQASLAEPEIQYADYAVWQRQRLQGEALERQLAYWKGRLADPPTLNLPTDRPRPVVQSYRGAREPFQISHDLTQKLGQVAREGNATMFMALLAGFNILLSRYSGQQDVIVGAPVANRTRAEVEKLIGFFVNMLAVRTEISNEQGFKDLLGRVREVTLGAYAHQDLPLEKLVEELHPTRDLSSTPLFQVTLTLQNAPREELKLRRLSLEGLAIETLTTKFDLTLTFWEKVEGLHGEISYKSELFEAATIKRMVGHYQQLLETLAGNPSRAISKVQMLSRVEVHQLLYEWNETGREYPERVSLHGLFETQALRNEEAMALVAEDHQVSYGELNRRANQLAHYLRELGVKSEELVGLCAERSIEMVVGLLGILKAGAAYLPLDPTFPPERLSVMVADAGARIVVSEASCLGGLDQAEAQVICLDRDWSKLRPRPETDLALISWPDQLAYVLYTSGSTGRPKGRMIEHRQAHNYYCAIRERLGLRAETHFAMVQPLSVDSCVTVIYPALCGGGTLHLISSGRALDGESLAEYFRRSGIECLKIAPSHLGLLARQLESCSDLMPSRQLVIGGEVSHWKLVRELQTQGARCAIYNHYRPTETTVGALTYRVEVVEGGIPMSATVPLGSPLANSQMYVLDRQEQLAPMGTSGELYIGGSGVGRGYLRRAELTAERFAPDPYGGKEGGRLYRTGDIVKYAGCKDLEFMGRVDDQVKARGFRIELGEIEAALRESPEVRSAVVAVKEDKVGEGRLVAYVVGAEGKAVVVNELRRSLKRRLPEYMMPASYVILEELPLTLHGKVDRGKLPVPEGSIERRKSAEARNPIEEMVADAYGQVLGLEEVGVGENFFERGGHSLLATRLILRLREAFQVELPMRSVFESPTVEEMARCVEAAMKEEPLAIALPIKNVERGKPLPMSFAQQRLWFLDQMETGSAAYNIPITLQMTGALDLPALKKSFKEVVRRHESLRTVFRMQAGEPVQMICDAIDVRLPVIDLHGLEVAEGQTEDRRILRDEMGRW